VLRRICLAGEQGTVTAILGASGSGKTTLLRLIAGFDRVDTGRIELGGRTVDDGHRHVRARHRRVGYVPQDSALFPHLTVAGNIGFGVSRGERARVGELLERVGLAGYERRYPHQLSGGQQQRVALARALAIQPELVLLDEPFSALDAGLRESVRADVMSILASTGSTTVLVTHDQDEALSVADRIALLDAGRILAHGSPQELYRDPGADAVARAIGHANLLPARVISQTGEVASVDCALGRLQVRLSTTAAQSCQVLVSNCRSAPLLHPRPYRPR
jgi:iron(III) transport system ATP-binding protein